jgi:hypothetical protein
MNVMHLTAALVAATVVVAPLAAQDTAAMGEGMMEHDTAAMAMPASDVSVEAVLARSVVDRVPQDSGSAFPAEVGQVVLWTRVSGASGQSVHHVWFRGDEQVGDVELAIGGSPWRTWSTKTVPAEWTGPWRVEVRDAAGNVIKTIAFTIG